MILVCGIPSETPLAMVLAELAQIAAPVLVLNQRHFTQWEVRYHIDDNGLSGSLDLGNRVYSLSDITAIYPRLMDDQLLPECGPPGSASPLGVLARARHEVLLRWIELSSARVLNRAAAMASNFSKPYQAQLIQAAGFLTPPTLVTSAPEAVRAFQRQHGRIVYKSISSARSVVQEFTTADDARLTHIRWCPTQFQAFIAGVNVRVHVAGEQVFATEIISDATDYRYAAAETGSAAELRPKELTPSLTDRCRALAHGLGLPLAGIDLKFAPDGRVYCFEVNPSPAFSYYETQTGQPIARAIAEYLAQASR